MVSDYWNVIKFENKYIVVDLPHLKKAKKKDRSLKVLFSDNQYWKAWKEMKWLNGESK